MGWTPNEGAARQARRMSGNEQLSGTVNYDVILVSDTITDNDETLTFASLTELTGGGYTSNSLDQTDFTYDGSGGYTATQQSWTFTGAPGANITAAVVVGDPAGTPFIYNIDLYTGTQPSQNGDIVRYNIDNTQD